MEGMNGDSLNGWLVGLLNRLEKTHFAVRRHLTRLSSTPIVRTLNF